MLYVHAIATIYFLLEQFKSSINSILEAWQQKFGLG